MAECHSITVYGANCRGEATNCLYPNRFVVTDVQSARAAFQNDIVCAAYQNNYRSIENFLSSDALPMDCDNDHSDNPADWITAEDVAEFFTGVPHIIHYSRHHGIIKGNRAPRPRFHVIFRIDKTIDADAYGKLKERVLAVFPFFDRMAKDSARFLFGTKNPQVEFHPGTVTLNTFLDDYESGMAFETWGNTIPEGMRNSTMSRIGARIIKRYGNTEEAYARFYRESEKCNPPLDDSELNTIWQSCQRFYKKVCSTPGYVTPSAYNATGSPVWETPIPFNQFDLPSFPADTLPTAVRDYVLAVAETTQTSVDIAAVASLAVLSICLQGKFRIWGKPDWSEPLNTYCVIALSPAERKSAVISLMTSPLEEYEEEINSIMDAQIIESQMRKSVLEKERRMLEDKVSKGKADTMELAEKAKEIASFHEVQPLKLFMDDVTAEKLASVLAENQGRGAIVSAEGGIFDILSGIYTKNVNIDVFLKGHSGDTIRVDRIGRASESIFHPTLTMLLAVQPAVLNGLMVNDVFRGRGLTARFLYAMPHSSLGTRAFRTEPIPETVKTEYRQLLHNLLNVNDNEEPIELTQEATVVLERLFHNIEGRFRTDLVDIIDWAGKYVGAVLRIAGILHAAEYKGNLTFVDVSGKTMENAVRIGEYFMEHAKAAYSLMGADPINKHCQLLLEAIKRSGLREFSQRDAMRLCRTIKTAEAAQPVLKRLSDYGYIALKAAEQTFGAGRRPSDMYLVNPCVLSN